jgi:hypothetical protein
MPFAIEGPVEAGLSLTQLRRFEPQGARAAGDLAWAEAIYPFTATITEYSDWFAVM